VTLAGQGTDKILDTISRRTDNGNAYRVLARRDAD
jgi:hypothetical protein